MIEFLPILSSFFFGAGIASAVWSRMYTKQAAAIRSILAPTEKETK